MTAPRTIDKALANILKIPPSPTPPSDSGASSPSQTRKIKSKTCSPDPQSPPAPALQDEVDMTSSTITSSKPIRPFFPSTLSNKSALSRSGTWTREQLMPSITRPDCGQAPLPRYDEDNRHFLYPNRFNPDGSARTPQKPKNFKDAYLYPTLSKNERERLTALWYFSSHINNNSRLQSQLQNIIELARDTMGHESCILSLIDHDYYNGIVSANWDGKWVPRRQAICSHTINQQVGTVFSVPNMKKDWRFEHCPFANAGYTSYEGTQLVYNGEGTNTQMILGTLCVTSRSPKMPLDPMRQSALKRFAKLIVHDIVEHAQVLRLAEKERMSEALNELMKSNLDVNNVFEKVLQTIRQMYPTAMAIFIRTSDGILQLRKKQVAFFKFENGQWEDTRTIDLEIIHNNHISSKSNDRSLRAIAIRSRSNNDLYLVLETGDLKCIFDDIDVAFIQQCSLLISTVIHEHTIQNITSNKLHYFRGVSHELRTPLHVIMSSCEFLLEDNKVIAQFKARRSELLLDQEAVEHVGQFKQSLTMLNLIDASSRSLLSTVNNLLDFERIEQPKTVNSWFLTSLQSIEEDVLHRVPLRTKPSVSMVVDNQIAKEDDLMVTDFDLLRQCLGSLIQNAFDFSQSGIITYKSALNDDYSKLTFDVIDHGIGIDEKDHERIFLPFEKVISSTHGPGLGLSIATRIASSLGGKLLLIHSTLGKGSHFRVTFENPTIACPITLANIPPMLPMAFCFVSSSGDDTLQQKYITRDLIRWGFEQVGPQNASLLLVEDVTSNEQMRKVGIHGSNQVIIHITSLEGNFSEACSGQRRLIICKSPVYRSRLWRVLNRAALIFREYADAKDLGFLSPKAFERHFRATRAKRERKSLRILLVDDNKLNLNVLKMYCKRRQFAWNAASSGAEAVENFEKGIEGGCRATLVLMDLQMPEMDGVEATKKLREIEQIYHVEPCLIFMVTGQSHDDDKERCLTAGANGYYIKPLRMGALDDLIALHYLE